MLPSPPRGAGIESGPVMGETTSRAAVPRLEGGARFEAVGRRGSLRSSAPSVVTEQTAGWMTGRRWTLERGMCKEHFEHSIR